MKKKLSFGERMKLLKEKKKQEAKDKELLEQFQTVRPLDERQVLILPPLSVTSETFALPTKVVMPTKLEETIQRLREAATKIKE